VCRRDRRNTRVRGPARGDEGSVLVEAALVVTVVLMVAFGLVDTAGAATTQAALDRSASAMARMARSGQAGSSDIDLLTFLYDPSLAGRLELRRVVVFRVLGADGALPAACDLRPTAAEATGVAGTCNVYGPAHLDALGAGVAPPRGCAAGSWEAAWCPAHRSRQPPEFIAVMVEAWYRPPVGLVTPSGGRMLQARAVVRTDPETS
jgi:hypothetical protein